MSTFGSFKSWKPDRRYLTAEQKEKNEFVNSIWPTGLEGGQFDSEEGIRSSSFSIFWFGLSMISRGMPLKPSMKRKQQLHEYFLSLGNVLPCRACRENFPKNLAQSGYDPVVHLQSRQSFDRFINHFHNTVNRMLQKPAYSYEDQRSNIETLRAKCVKGKNGNEGGCHGKMHGTDPRATCVINVVPECEAKKFIKKHGSSVCVSAACKINQKKLSSKRKTTRRRKS